jgi:hypothetical protein
MIAMPIIKKPALGDVLIMLVLIDLRGLKVAMEIENRLLLGRLFVEFDGQGGIEKICCGKEFVHA